MKSGHENPNVLYNSRWVGFVQSILDNAGFGGVWSAADETLN